MDGVTWPCPDCTVRCPRSLPGGPPVMMSMRAGRASPGSVRSAPPHGESAIVRPVDTIRMARRWSRITA